MPAVHIQPAQPRAGHIRYLPRIPAQYCIGFGKRLRVGNGPDDRQVIRAGATERSTSLQLLGVQFSHSQPLRQIDGNFVQQRQVALVLGHRRRKVFAMEVKTGAQCMFTLARRCHIAFRAHHGAQCQAAGGGRQAGDLPADALEW
ncbi:hypothetical protein D3C79_818140 [compost metagenome]